MTDHDFDAQPTEESGAFDIICPECSGMLNDVVYENFINLYCPACDIEWRV